MYNHILQKMRFNLCFAIFLLGCINFVCISNADHTDSGESTTLKLVQVLFRHGDRNPIDPYPNARYRDESNWPGGYAQLTKKGKMQQYLLGQWLRQRYHDYLNASYSPYEIFAKSSNVDRTIMSAESNLAGLYPPNDDFSTWNPKIPWQPIPVHTESSHGDRYLKMDENCTKLQNLNKDFLDNSPVMKKIREEYGYLFELLTNKTGKPIKTPEDVDYVYDVLYIENLYFGEWPDWAPEGSSTLEAMRNLTKFSFQQLSYTEEMQRLKGGPILKELLENFEQKAAGKLDARRKFFMYSAHDTTVAVLLNTMGVFDVQIPGYTSMVILELYQDMSNVSDPNGLYFLKISLRNETDREPYLLTIPGCDNPCSLRNFREALKEKIPGDWQQECNQSFYDNIGIGVTILTIGSLAVFILVVFSVCVSLFKKRKRNDAKPPPYPYLHLQMDDEDA